MNKLIKTATIVVGVGATYTNTRLGVKLTYGEKNGTLILKSL